MTTNNPIDGTAEAREDMQHRRQLLTLLAGDLDALGDAALNEAADGNLLAFALQALASEVIATSAALADHIETCRGAFALLGGLTSPSGDGSHMAGGDDDDELVTALHRLGVAERLRVETRLDAIEARLGGGVSA